MLLSSSLLQRMVSRKGFTWGCRDLKGFGKKGTETTAGELRKQWMALSYGNLVKIRLSFPMCYLCLGQCHVWAILIGNSEQCKLLLWIDDWLTAKWNNEWKAIFVLLLLSISSALNQLHIAKGSSLVSWVRYKKNNEERWVMVKWLETEPYFTRLLLISCFQWAL